MICCNIFWQRLINVNFFYDLDPLTEAIDSAEKVREL